MKHPGPRVVAELLVHAMPGLEDRLRTDRLRRAWRDVVGPDVARHAAPRDVTQGCLHVVVDNSPWLQELTLRSAELTARIAARCDTIRSLRFTLGPPDAATAAPSAAPAPSPRPLGPDDVRAIDDSLAPIRDPEVKAAARRLLVAARRSATPRGAV